MGLKEECLRVYRRNERLKRWQAGGFCLEQLKRIEDHVKSLFGNDAKYVFTHASTNARDCILVKEDGIYFLVELRTDNYEPRFYVSLVSVCQKCGKRDFITHLGYNLQNFSEATKLEIARQIVERGYKGAEFVCIQCQKQLIKEAEQEAS